MEKLSRSKTIRCFHSRYLQKRLGRKRPPARLIAEIPVGLMIFDLLSYEGRNLLDEPLIERKKLIESIDWPHRCA